MSVDSLLSRLERVKKTGPTRWRACCPAHGSKNQTLAIDEKPDGRLMVRCHAECATEDVLAAVGLTFSELYPERLPEHGYQRIRRPFNPHDLIDCLSEEVTIAAVIAADMHKGREISRLDYERLFVAAGRLHAAQGVINGR